jgi:hypothetical protein
MEIALLIQPLPPGKQRDFVAAIAIAVILPKPFSITLEDAPGRFLVLAERRATTSSRKLAKADLVEQGRHRASALEHVNVSDHCFASRWVSIAASSASSARLNFFSVASKGLLSPNGGPIIGATEFDSPSRSRQRRGDVFIGIITQPSLWQRLQLLQRR